MHVPRKVVGLLLITALSITSLAGCSRDKDEDGKNVEPTNNNSLSGAIAATAGTMVDSDVNDPLASRVSNDTYQTAQLIPNPVVLGGYANEAHRGEPGASFLSGDTSDFYKVYLQAGQSIVLVIADKDPAANDLDLYLYSESSPDSYLTSSESIGSHEFITVPGDNSTGGYYYIKVAVWSGATNYVLSIGQSTDAVSALGQQDRLSSQSEFVPGELIVRFKDEVAFTAQSTAQSLGLSVKAGGAERAMLMMLPEQGPVRAQALNALGVPQRRIAGDATDAKQRDKEDTIMAIKAMRKRKDVLYAEPNYLRRALLVPNDSRFSEQWHYPLINLPGAWDITTGSNAVIVAVVDTGVLLNHPDLQGQLVEGYDFISLLDYSRDGDGRDDDPNDPGDSPTGGSSFHGTHVAGTIAARTNNSLGVAGVAWDARIMPLRVLGSGGVGTSYDIMQALRYAAGFSNDSGRVPAKRADIINLSLGGPASSNHERDVYQQVYDAGVLVVAAAGNENSSAASYPAGYDAVISVSAVDRNKALSSYSNFGSTIDLAAPGGDRNNGVLSTRGNDSGTALVYTYDQVAGTSMAAPHVSGVLALMKAVYPALTPIQLEQMLACGLLTEDIGDAGRDNSFGFGLIDAEKTVSAAQALAASGDFSCNVPQVSPASLNFGNAETSAMLEVRRIGNQALSVAASVPDGINWLTVTPANVDAQGFGNYQVTVDRSQVVGEGAFRSSITFTTSSGGEVKIGVLILRSTVNLPDDAGHLYLFLLDAQSSEIVQEVPLAASNGQYRYQFDDITAGNYFLQAGTDNDNNFLVCEPGEACGAYLVGGGVIQVNGDVSGIDFEVGYDVQFISPPQSIKRQSGSGMSPKLTDMNHKTVPK